MQIKLIATDMDGTLLNRKHEISEENKAAVRRAVERGVAVTIATGRMYASALPYAKQLKVDAPIITYNGALVKTVSGETLFERYIDPDAVGEIFRFCRERNWYIQAYCDDVLYVERREEKARGYEAMAGIESVAVGEELYQMRERIPKLLLITEGGEASDACVKLFQAHFGGRVFATKSNPEYIEIVDPAVNKAAALDILIERLGLSREEVMAIGDSNNDLPMLRHAGVSVAMGNAADSIKECCDFVTEDCDRGGVAKAIEKYALNRQSL